MKLSHFFVVMLAALVSFMTACNTTSEPAKEAKTETTKAEKKQADKAKKTQKAKAKKTDKAKKSDKTKKNAKAKAKQPAKKITLEQAIKTATTPVQYKRHEKRHAEKLAYAKANKDKIKILMLGDSITHQWEYKPAAKAKAAYLDPYAVLNLGCGGDRTQHTLWIVEKSGILEQIKPQLVTIMIGTNNRVEPKATAAGIKRIVDDVRKLYPDAKILLYAIFPRGKDNKDVRRIQNEKVNAEIVKLCDNKNVIWVDIRKKFLTKDGVLEKSVMPDLLHPRTSKAYSIWGKSLKPYFDKYGK